MIRNAKLLVIILVVVLITLSAIAVYENCESQKSVETLVLANCLPEKARWDVEGKHYKVPCFADNSSAKDCTYEDLLVFLKEDKTDQMTILDDDPLNSCERYSLTLHNNAERVGIRCGYSIITFVEIDELYGRFGHALCVFNTLDRGLIFIDDTYSPTVDVDRNSILDKTGEVVAGKVYRPHRLFGDVRYRAMGTVESVDIYWSELDE